MDVTTVLQAQHAEIRRAFRQAALPTYPRDVATALASIRAIRDAEKRDNAVARHADRS